MLTPGASAVTNASGAYNFGGLPAAGVFVLTPTLAGYAFAPPSQTIANLSSNQTVNFTATKAITISGVVSVSGVPAIGVLITVTGSQITNAITGASGAYSVTLPSGGTYTIFPSRAGYSFSSAVTYSNLTSNQTTNFTGIAVSGLDFYAVTPCRVADTRAAAGFPSPFGAPGLSAAQSRSFPIQSSTCGIPANAQAYSLNVTAMPKGNLGLLTAWPTGQPLPNASTLNSYTGTVVANAAIVPAGTNGAISIYASDATDVLFDINGYFAPPAGNGLEFHPVAPCRIADTRSGGNKTAGFGPPGMGAGQTRVFPIPSSTCGIPSTAKAYSLNFTVVSPGYLGVLSTWPTGEPQPNVSTLNLYNAKGGVLSNAAIVSAGSNGAISVYTSDATDVLFDINGYFAPAQSSGLLFYPVTPCRIADTRPAAAFAGALGAPAMRAGQQRSFQVPSSACEIPGTAGAYSFNFTALTQGYLGVFTTWPVGQSLPVVSTMNYYGTTPGTVANAAIVPAGTNGAINIAVTDSTDVIFDINGYFAQ
jgi:hypothetical protein